MFSVLKMYDSIFIVLFRIHKCYIAVVCVFSGYECVNYPLSCVTHEKFMQEDCNAISTQPGLELSSAQLSADESEPHSEIAGDPPGGQHGELMTTSC